MSKYTLIKFDCDSKLMLLLSILMSYICIFSKSIKKKYILFSLHTKYILGGANVFTDDRTQ